MGNKRCTHFRLCRYSFNPANRTTIKNRAPSAMLSFSLAGTQQRLCPHSDRTKTYPYFAPKSKPPNHSLAVILCVEIAMDSRALQTTERNVGPIYVRDEGWTASLTLT